MRNKKGAIELSVGTVVIIAIGVTLLILGLVFVRNIIQSATGSVELIDRNVKAQINQLFNEDDRKTVVYLADNEAIVEKGKSYNVRFGIKNTIRGESEAGQFTYQTRVSEIQRECRGLSEAVADSFIIVGGEVTNPIPILPGGEPVERIIKVEPSETAPLCTIIYDIIVKKDGQDYDTSFFILRIEG